MSTNRNISDAAIKPSRLWLWFIAAFLIQVAAWTTWLAIASHNMVQEVPLETAISIKR